MTANTPRRALLIDADDAFADTLNDASFDCATTSSDEARSAADAFEPGLVVVGAEVSGADGRELVEDLVETHGCIALVIVDGYTPDAVGRVLEMGVDAFVQAGVSDAELLRIIEQEIRGREKGHDASSDRVSIPRMVGSSDPMKNLCKLLARTAPSSLTVLITGESGTGKELVARSIHRLSPRRDGAFIAVNCGAIPESLIESELFGHEKGAFTGATERKPGKFEAADGGTLFLDEIGELPLQMQVKLLRVLEDRSFHRVGGSKSIDVDIRLVCATNRDLEAAVESGDFRPDLFYRIDVLRIETPPLRRRKSDIETLWDHFVQKTAAEEGREALETRPDVVRMLMRYDWPGNVRELENVARQAVIRRSRGKITPRIVRDRLRGGGRTETQDPAAVPLRSLEAIERDAIIRTYHAVDSVKEAAEILGISERKMYYRLKQYREQGHLRDESDEDRPRVIFAHGDEDVFDSVSGELGESFETAWVKDGTGLLGQVYESSPDALVVQTELPILDGINVLELGYEHGWDIPVVLVSGSDDDAMREYAEALGAAAYLTGSVDPGQLAWVLDTALNVKTA